MYKFFSKVAKGTVGAGLLGVYGYAVEKEMKKQTAALELKHPDCDVRWSTIYYPGVGPAWKYTLEKKPDLEPCSGLTNRS